MVRAILDGTKTQTRRVVKGFNPLPRVDVLRGLAQKCPYGIPGDRLWVRETWAPGDHILKGYDLDTPEVIAYRADKTAATDLGPIDTYAWNWNLMKWKPSIFMPRWASRIDLEITEVWVQRLQEITEEDAKAEGVRLIIDQDGKPLLKLTGARPIREWTFREHFAELWDSINSKRGFGWDENPLVWVITFRRIRP